MRDKLIEAREKSGLTRFELANKLGVSVSTIEKVEKGTRNASINLARNWARFIHVQDILGIFYAHVHDNMSSMTKAG